MLKIFKEVMLYRWLEWGSRMSYIIAHLLSKRFVLDQFDFCHFSDLRYPESTATTKWVSCK